MYEAVIKVRLVDPPAARARDIAEGIGYACALLTDEYGWTAELVAELLERVTDDVADEAVRNGC
jgi:hypothetical protein